MGSRHNRATGHRRGAADRGGIFAAAFVLALAAAGCNASGGNGGPSPSLTEGGEEWAATVERARAQGQVVNYTVEQEPWIQAVHELFQRQTGIAASNPPRTPTGPMLERFSAEVAANAVQSDVLQVGDLAIWAEHPEWFVDLSTAGLPNWDSYPESAKGPGNRCVHITYGVGGIAVNTSVPENERPRSWEDVVDPRWRGQVVLTDPRSSTVYMGWAMLMEEVYGLEYLEAIADLEPDLAQSATPAAEQTAANAYKLSFMTHASNTMPLIEVGAPLEWIIPEGPSVGNAACAGIPVDAPHPDAAKVLLNFLMSPEAQSAGCGDGAHPIVGSPLNAPNCLVLPDGWTPTPFDDLGNTARVDRILKALGIT